MELVLASTSPYRRELLARLGLPFRSEAPGVDERAFQADLPGPEALVTALASAKAGAVAGRFPAAVVIGSDQIVEFEGRILGKPGTAEAAVEQLLAMAGKEHRLLTAIALADAGGVETHLEVSRLRFRTLTRDEVERYISAERPLDCAGSYKIEGLGIALFDRIESADPTGIIGLPLLAVCRMLRARGFRVP